MLAQQTSIIAFSGTYSLPRNMGIFKTPGLKHPRSWLFLTSDKPAVTCKFCLSSPVCQKPKSSHRAGFIFLKRPYVQNKKKNHTHFSLQSAKTSLSHLAEVRCVTFFSISIDCSICPPFGVNHVLNVMSMGGVGSPHFIGD